MRRFLRSTTAAWSGLRRAWREQRNLRIEAALGLAALALALLLGTGLVPVLLACAIVIVAELFNTAVEALADIVEPRRDPRVAVVKDVAAAAVLLAAATAALTGLIVLGPALWTWFRGLVG